MKYLDPQEYKTSEEGPVDSWSKQKYLMLSSQDPPIVFPINFMLYVELTAKRCRGG